MKPLDLLSELLTEIGLKTSINYTLNYILFWNTKIIEDDSHQIIYKAPQIIIMTRTRYKREPLGGPYCSSVTQTELIINLSDPDCLKAIRNYINQIYNKAGICPSPN